MISLVIGSHRRDPKLFYFEESSVSSIHYAYSCYELFKNFNPFCFVNLVIECTTLYFLRLPTNSWVTRLRHSTVGTQLVGVK